MRNSGLAMGVLGSGPEYFFFFLREGYPFGFVFALDLCWRHLEHKLVFPGRWQFTGFNGNLSVEYPVRSGRQPYMGNATAGFGQTILTGKYNHKAYA